MSSPVHPSLLLACCTNYAFVALDDFWLPAEIYRLRWVDPSTLQDCQATGPLAEVLQAMATACEIRVPAPGAPLATAS